MHYESDHKSPEECLLELMKENLPPEEVIRRFKEKGYSLEGEGKKEDYEEKGKDEHSDYDKEDKKEYSRDEMIECLMKDCDSLEECKDKLDHYGYDVVKTDKEHSEHKEDKEEVKEDDGVMDLKIKKVTVMGDEEGAHPVPRMAKLIRVARKAMKKDQ